MDQVAESRRTRRVKEGIGSLPSISAAFGPACPIYLRNPGKNQPPLCGRRVEGFGQAAKANASQPQSLDGFDQLLHRARQAVELPYDQRIAAAREFERV